jgi:autotransporter translocation and assembly factor TamB
VRRAKRRFPVLRVIGIGLILVIVAIPILLFVATLPPGERFIKGVLESQLTDQLHQPVSIEIFETNLLSRVQILGLRIADARDGRKTPALEVGAIKVHYDLSQLLHRVVAVRSVEIDSVRIVLERDRRRTFNVALLDSAARSKKPEKEKDTSRSAWRVRLDRFSLNGPSVHAVDSLLPASAAIDGLDILAVRGEQADSYDLVLDTGTGTLQYARYPAADLNLRLHAFYSDSGIRLDSLIFRSSGLQLRADGIIPLKENAPIKAHARLTGSLQPLYTQLKKPLHLPPMTMNGDIVIDAVVGGTRRRPEAKVRADLPAVNVRYAGLSRSLIAARWRGDSLDVDTLRVRVFNGAILGSTHLALGDTMRGSGALAVRGLSLASLYVTLKDTMSSYVGDIDGDVAILLAGKEPTNWSFNSAFTISKFAHLADSLPDVHLSASLLQRQANLSLVQDELNMRAQVTVLPRDRLAGGFSLTVPDVGAIGALVMQGEKTSGSMEVHGDVGGTLRSPAFNATLRGDRITYRNFPLDRVEATVSYDKKGLMVARANLAGDLTVDPQHPPFGLDSLRGRITYSGEAQGPVDSIQGRFLVLLDQPAFKGIRADSGRLEILSSGRIVSISSMEIHRDTMALSARGAYSLDSVRGNLTATILSPGGATQAGRSGEPDGGNIVASFAMPEAKQMQLSATGRGLDLRTIASIVLDTARVSGLLDFEFKGGGSPANPAGAFHVSLREPRYDSLMLDSITSSVTLKDGRIDVRSFDIYGPRQRLTASAVARMQKDSTGKFALLETSPIEGKVEARNFDLHSAEAVLPKDARLSGIASLDLRWNGTVKKPNATGSFDLRDLHVLMNPKVGLVDLNLHGSIRGPAVHIDSARGIMMNQPFTISGSIEAEDWKQFNTDIGLTVADSAHLTAKGVVSSDRLDLRAQIQRLNLALAQPFVTSMTELAGILDSRVQFTGSLKNPNTSGFLTVRGLKFHPPVLDSAFTDGVVSVNFAGNTVHLDTIRARSQYGTLSIAGDVALGEGTISSANIKTVVRHLPLSSEDNFTARIDSADLVFQGQTGAYTLGGDIIFGESRWIKDVDIASFIGKQSVLRASEPKPGLMQQTRLDLRVRGSDSLYVDNNVANLRMHLELGIIGRPDNPVLTGLVSIPEGNIFYLDREFQVKQGRFLFSDPNKINPEINLQAESEVTSYQGMNASTYTITFSAQGLMSELETNLSSTPPLDNSDIIALLTLGTTRTQLTQGGGGTGGSGTVLQDRAEQLASQRISGALGRKAGKALGLDSVSVNGNLFNFGDSWGPQLVISKRISPRTRITYSTNVGHINNQSFRINYMLTKTLLLEGETDDRGNSVFSIIYGIQFP